MRPTSIEPNRVPTGYVFMFFLDDSDNPVLTQEVTEEKNAPLCAAHAAERTDEWVAAGHVVHLVVFDGESGARVRGGIADGAGRRALP